MTRIFPLFCFVLFLVACEEPAAQSITDDTPEAVKVAFQKQYPGEDDPDWHLDDRGNYEAHFKQDGEKWRADYRPDGTWVETEATIKFKDLPTLVQNAIESEYDEDDITEIELVKHPTKGVFYDVEFKYGGQKWDTEYDAGGQIIGREDGPKKDQ